MTIDIDRLRRFAVHRSLFPPTTLARAMRKLGFVQADPIRSPARAQDLTLRHRVDAYRAGDLERRYSTLDIEEDFFINYGFVTRSLQTLMHPRGTSGWSRTQRSRAHALLEFVRARGAIHPREADVHFAHGRVTNYWGRPSSATTRLLDEMQYRGLVRVARRESGIRIYAVRDPLPEITNRAERLARVDALIDVVVAKYAPLPAIGLSRLVSRLRYAIPQWSGELKRALRRATARLAQAHVDGVLWYWPADERLPRDDAPDVVRLLSPFDPVVWDRHRFEMLWGWAYRFEAYTPVPERLRGYYALPLLWRDRVVGWGNLSVVAGELRSDIGYVDGPVRDRHFARELEAELHRMRVFLGIDGAEQETSRPRRRRAL